jgi:hypothetical protein
VNDGDRCGSSTGRDGGDRAHGKNQELTTKLESLSARPEVVRKRRSMANSHRIAELVGADWRPPSTLGLNRRARKSLRSFRASPRSFGVPVPAASKLIGARVSATLQK